VDKALAHDDAILQAREVLKGRYLVVDTETTGLVDPEVCQLAYVLEDAKYFDTYVKPQKPISPEATAVHGITDEMVADGHGINAYWPEVSNDILGRKIVGYNLQYDLKGIAHSLTLWGVEIDPKNYGVFDVMYCYAAFHGEVHPTHGTFKWQKLEEAYKQCGIEWGDMHNALSDARGTLALLWYISEQRTTWEHALSIACRFPMTTKEFEEALAACTYARTVE
jgi:DNA polymerase-3 subunit epsilon